MKWISVEERLPPSLDEIDDDEDMTYLVTIEHPNGVRSIRTADYCDDCQEKWVEEIQDFPSYWRPLPAKYKVVAWMELPEVYK
jgi:hypothetical protein